VRRNLPRWVIWAPLVALLSILPNHAIVAHQAHAIEKAVRK